MICMKCLATAPDEFEKCPKCGAAFKLNPSTDFGKRLNIKNEWRASMANKDAQDSTSKLQKNQPESLIPWIKSEFKKAMSNAPMRIKTLAIYGGIVLAVNLIFWTVDPYFMPLWLQPFRGLISTVVFLTATYNDIIPKTIFWVIIFTFGKKLFHSMRKKGFKASFECLKNVVPNFKSALGRMGQSAYPLLLIGAGMGLMIANNFASYSRFSGARNKFDKYFIVLVMAFTISYLLGEANKTGFYKFIKLGSNDLAKLAGRKRGLSDDSVNLLLSAFVAGLLLDAPLILMKFMYGGYMLGAVAVLAGFALAVASGKKPEVKA